MSIQSINHRILQSILPFLYAVGFLLGTFVGGTWASLGIGGALIIVLCYGLAERRFPHISLRSMTPIFIFFGGAAALNVIALSPRISWHSYLQELSIIIPLSFFFIPEFRKRVLAKSNLDIMGCAAVIGTAALGIEFMLDMPLLRHLKGELAGASFYNRGVSYLAIMIMPIIAYQWSSGQRRTCLFIVALLMIPLYYTESRATKLAFAAAWATLIIAYYLPRISVYLIGFFLLTLLSWPFVVTSLFLQHHELVTRLPPSWWARVEIWDYMSYRIFERPISGWGLGSSNLLPYTIPHGQSYHWVLGRASHPHNVILQIWVELGVFGLLFLYSTTFYILYRISKLPRLYVAFGLGTFVSAIIVSLVAYSFWDDSLFAMFTFCILLYRFLCDEANLT